MDASLGPKFEARGAHSFLSPLVNARQIIQDLDFFTSSGVRLALLSKDRNMTAKKMTLAIIVRTTAIPLHCNWMTLFTRR